MKLPRWLRRSDKIEAPVDEKPAEQPANYAPGPGEPRIATQEEDAAAVEMRTESIKERLAAAEEEPSPPVDPSQTPKP